MSKHIIGDVDFIECPYCSKPYKLLHWKHLKQHDKTLDDVLSEFPGRPTMTKAEYEKKKNTARMGAQASKQTIYDMKIIYCIYKNDNDCPAEPHKVPNNHPNKWVCDVCRSLGKEEVDGKRMEDANVARTTTLQKKHGSNIINAGHVPGVKEKKSATNVERYDGTGFASPELAAKSRATSKEKYGNEFFMKTEEGKALFRGERDPEIGKKISSALKGKSSKLKGKFYNEIHGVEKAEQLKEDKRRVFREKFIKNDFPKLLDYFGFEFIDEEFLGAHIFHNFRCRKCGTIMYRQWNSIQQRYRCEICYPRNNGSSIAEQEILSFIKFILPDEEVIHRTRIIIAPKELDIFIPSRMVAIEHNGIWYHSDSHVNFGGPKYHMEKTSACQKLGIRLIQIFEDEWALKKEICKSRLMQILGVSSAKRIHGRKCKIREIESNIKNQFLDKYHIQGHDMSSIKLGAYYDNELVSVMTFAKGNPAKGVKKPKKYTWELNRFCINSSYHIPGIASKLLSYFKNNYKWLKIYSYADRRWSNGDLYIKMGFKQERGIRLNYWYVKNGKRIHRYALRKRPNEPKDIKEKTLRLLEGYSIMWDCGNLKFVLENTLTISKI